MKPVPPLLAGVILLAVSVSALANSLIVDLDTATIDELKTAKEKITQRIDELSAPESVPLDFDGSAFEEWATVDFTYRPKVARPKMATYPSCITTMI